MICFIYTYNMARPLRIQFSGAHYHIFSRGNRKENIFIQKKDYITFIEKLKECLKKFNVDCVAFVLMKNHYHLYIITNECNLSEFMQNLNSSYTNWFKTKYELTGNVFQGRYKSILIDKDNYSKQIIDYIHFNPVKAGYEKICWKYLWSSCGTYVNEKIKFDFVNVNFLLNQLSDNRKLAHKIYTENIISKTNFSLPHRNLYKGIAYGNEQFKSKIDKLIKNHKIDINFPSTLMNKRRNSDFFVNAIINYFNIKHEDIFNKKQSNLYKKILIYLLKTQTRMKNKDIAFLFDIQPASITNNYKNFKKELSKNSEFLRILTNLENHIYKT